LSGAKELADESWRSISLLSDSHDLLS